MKTLPGPRAQSLPSSTHSNRRTTSKPPESRSRREILIDVAWHSGLFAAAAATTWVMHQFLTGGLVTAASVALRIWTTVYVIDLIGTAWEILEPRDVRVPHTPAGSWEEDDLAGAVGPGATARRASSSARATIAKTIGTGSPLAVRSPTLPNHSRRVWTRGTASRVRALRVRRSGRGGRVPVVRCLGTRGRTLEGL